MTDDLRLLELLQQGNQPAFYTIHDRYFNRIFAFARSIVSEVQAQEVAQDAFIALWTNRQKIRDIDHAFFFMMKVAKNGCYDIIKASKVELKHKERIFQQLAEENKPTLFHHGIEADLLDRIDSVVKSYPQRYRRIYKLAYKDQLTDEEIARLLKVTKRTVINDKSHLSASIRKEFFGNPDLAISMALLGGLETLLIAAAATNSQL